RRQRQMCIRDRVKTVVENLATDNKAKGSTAKVVRGMIQKRLSVNRVDLDKEDIVIEKTKEGLSVVIDYERRVGFVGNVDLVAKFSHSTIIPK
ncbi:MAG: DUF4845 domain-containing protein, partial [Pseudomonadales bacterium]|nr:DUF4845 domain-containing protein [Pseudomonadales bacterium]